MARVILYGGLMLFCRRLDGWQDKCKRMQRRHREYRSIYCRLTTRQMTIETEHVDFFAIGSSAPVEGLGELRRQSGRIKHLASTDLQHAYEYRETLSLIQETIRQLQRAGQNAGKTA